MPALTLAGTGSLCNLPVKRRQTSRNLIEALRPQCAAFTWHDRGHDLFIGLTPSRNGSRAGFRHG
jgi:hypothetical protein